MADIVDRKTRSRMMSSVRQRNTRPEIEVRRMLHKAGYRFRINRKDLSGSPDIVLPKYKTAVFVHGCFWHQHPGCPKARRPQSNTEYWNRKLDENIARDKKCEAELMAAGWHVQVVWECELGQSGSVEERLTDFLASVESNGTHSEVASVT